MDIGKTGQDGMEQDEKRWAATGGQHRTGWDAMSRKVKKKIGMRRVYWDGPGWMECDGTGRDGAEQEGM
jgi:hypothetical protein